MNRTFIRKSHAAFVAVVIASANFLNVARPVQAGLFHKNSSESQSTTTHKSFFKRHPFLTAAGIGVATGGIGTAIMGGSAMSGAVLGAGKGVGAYELKRKIKKNKDSRSSSE